MEIYILELMILYAIFMLPVIVYSAIVEYRLYKIQKLKTLKMLRVRNVISK